MAQHLAKSETIEITLNKEHFEKSGIPFSDASSILPVTLVDDFSGVKATGKPDTGLKKQKKMYFMVKYTILKSKVYDHKN